MAISTNVFASIKPAAQPVEPFNNSDYVGTVVSAEYTNASATNGQPELLILTLPDSKNTDNKLTSFNLRIDGNDLPWGFVLANSVGKKIAVIFSGSYDQIKSVEVVTDEFYYGAGDVDKK